MMRRIIAAAVVVAGLSASSFAGVGFMANYNGVGPGFAGTVGLTNSIYLNLGAQFNLEAIKSPDTLKGTSATNFWIPLWLSFYLTKVGCVTPYIPLGINYKMNLSSDADAKSGATTIGIGPFTGLGIEWSVNDNIGVWAECDLTYTYYMTTAKADGVPDVKSNTHSVSLAQSGVGITFYF